MMIPLRTHKDEIPFTIASICLSEMKVIPKAKKINFTAPNRAITNVCLLLMNVITSEQDGYPFILTFSRWEKGCQLTRDIGDLNARS
jgi:hypothetical protein